MDNQNVSLSLTKFRPSDDVNFLGRLGFQVRVADVGSPCFHAIELSEEQYKMESSKTNNSRVDRLKWNFGEMTVSN